MNDINKENKMKLSNQALGALMMTLQKCLLEQTDITQSLRDLYNIEITSDAKQSRSREQFNIAQSYEVSSDNREWFANTFRPEDYELMDYISQREYYK